MIPLRLRRRRDGSLCLTDANSSVTSPDRAFPETHAFRFDWMRDNKVVSVVDGDQVKIELANGRATYRIVEGDDPSAIYVELIPDSVELFDPPPVEGTD